jgi:phosphate transport system permease protein
MKILDGEKIFAGSVKFTGRLVAICMLSLPVFLFYHSLPILDENSLKDLLFSGWKPSERIYGLGSFVLTSLLTAFSASFFAFGISVSAALFIYFRRRTVIGRILYRSIKVMSGIPTVVYGLAGIMIMVPLVRNYTPSSSGLCLLTVIIVLTVLIIPTMAVYMINGLDLIDKDLVSAGLSLGADEPQMARYILIPGAKKFAGIAFILGFSRAISDTMVALMVSGNSFRFPASLFQSARNVTSHIALLIPGEFSGIEFKAVFFSSLVLVMIVILLNSAVMRMEGKK